jgi:hypothetical protein
MYCHMFPSACLLVSLLIAFVTGYTCWGLVSPFLRLLGGLCFSVGRIRLSVVTSPRRRQRPHCELCATGTLFVQFSNPSSTGHGGMTSLRTPGISFVHPYAFSSRRITHRFCFPVAAPPSSAFMSSGCSFSHLVAASVPSRFDLMRAGVTLFGRHDVLRDEPPASTSVGLLRDRAGRLVLEQRRVSAAERRVCLRDERPRHGE